MENLYEILQCSSNATIEELRKSYIHLVRQCHPDKIEQFQQIDDSPTDTTNSSKDHGDSKHQSTQQFLKIDRAWKILRDSDLRAQFDLKWQERQIYQDHPIQDTVAQEDFEWDDEDNVYCYPCRCGSDYVLTESDIKLLFDFVCCESCSLTIKVIYS